MDYLPKGQVAADVLPRIVVNALERFQMQRQFVKAKPGRFWRARQQWMRARPDQAGSGESLTDGSWRAVPFYY